MIDIGNSAVKSAVMTPYGQIVEYSVDRNFPFGRVEDLVRRHPVGAALWLSTRADDAGIGDFLERICPGAVRFRPGITPVPIENLYDDPRSLGADRLALAVGVRDVLPGRDVLIFDFGTALTVDFLSRSGQFLGGHISAGLQLRADALASGTGLLPRIDMSGERPDSGDSGRPFPSCTRSAIYRGVMNSMEYEIEGYIRRFPEADTVFTGNAAKYFAEKFKITIFADNDSLVLRGLNTVLMGGAMPQAAARRGVDRR